MISTLSVDIVSKPHIIRVDGSRTRREWEAMLAFRNARLEVPFGPDGLRIKTQGNVISEALALPARGETLARLMTSIADMGLQPQLSSTCSKDPALPGQAWRNARIEDLMAFATAADLMRFPRRTRVMALAASLSDIVGRLGYIHMATLQWDPAASAWSIVPQPIRFRHTIDWVDAYVLAIRELTPSEVLDLNTSIN